MQLLAALIAKVAGCFNQKHWTWNDLLFALIPYIIAGGFAYVAFWDTERGKGIKWRVGAAAVLFACAVALGLVSINISSSQASALERAEKESDILRGDLAHMSGSMSSQIENMKQEMINLGCSPAVVQRITSQLKAMQGTAQQYQTPAYTDPSLGIKITHITLTQNGDPSIPFSYKNTLSLNAKVDFTLTNSGNSPATHVAASFVLGQDNGAPSYPAGYGCEDTSSTSEYQYRWAPNVSVFPNQAPLLFERVPVKGAFPAISNGVIVVGCVLYKSGNDETHATELHAIQIVFGVGVRHTPEGFEATDALVKYVAPTLPSAAIR